MPSSATSHHTPHHEPTPRSIRSHFPGFLHQPSPFTSRAPLQPYIYTKTAVSTSKLEKTTEPLDTQLAIRHRQNVIFYPIAQNSNLHRFGLHHTESLKPRRGYHIPEAALPNILHPASRRQDGAGDETLRPAGHQAHSDPGGDQEGLPVSGQPPVAQRIPASMPATAFPKRPLNAH